MKRELIITPISRSKSPNSGSKRVEVLRKRRKVMATLFWNALGEVLICILEKGKTISQAYYAELFVKLLRPKRLFSRSQSNRSHGYSCSCQPPQIALKIVSISSISPHVSSNDYFLFSNLKDCWTTIY